MGFLSEESIAFFNEFYGNQMSNKPMAEQTPKEKAQELVDKFADYNISHMEVKECALITVDEIIINQPRYPSNVDWDDCGGTHKYYYEEQRAQAQKYWEQVKTEIENL